MAQQPHRPQKHDRERSWRYFTFIVFAEVTADYVIELLKLLL